MELTERILRQNPWWDGKDIESLRGLKERKILQEILKYKKDKQAIAIIGLRRVGKTVLMLQFISHLLKETSEKRILYFSFDEILSKEPEIIEKVLDAYENEILREELKNVYVFFDEINHIPDWQVIVKRYYDLDKNIKFIVSGSSGIYLKKTKESLAGRIYEFELSPLTFEEFLYLKGIEVKELNIQKLTFKREINNYLLKGGFPEIIREENFDKIKAYVKSIVEKIVFYDIPKVYDVGNPEILHEILGLIARKPGAIVEYQNVAATLKVTYQTVSKYVSYLEKAFLINRVYNYRGSPVARARKSKKIYLKTPTLAVAFLDSEDETFSLISNLVENLVQNHLNAKFFWREYYELDFLYNRSPVEVKYVSGKPEIKGTLEVTKRVHSEKLAVITKDFEKKEVREGITVQYLPLWKFLLLPKTELDKELWKKSG